MRLWIKLCTGAPHRMNDKIYSVSFIFFLCAVLQAQTSTPAVQTGSEGSNTANTITMPPGLIPTGSRVGGRETRDSDSSPESSTTEQTTRQHNSNINHVSADTTTSEVKTSKAPNEDTTKKIMQFTSPPASTVTPSRAIPEKNGNHQAVAWGPKWDQDFTYDYESLRLAGLSIAAFLFIIGIMVISCHIRRPMAKEEHVYTHTSRAARSQPRAHKENNI